MNFQPPSYLLIGNLSMPATTPNRPSKRKKIDKMMNKAELMEEVRYHRQKEEEYENLITELKHNVKEVKDEVNEIKSEQD